METSITTLTLERCAQTIEKVVVPNVTGEFALSQAQSIARVLHILAPAVEEKCQELWEENEGMREVLGRVLEALRGEKAPPRNAVRNKLIGRLDDELKKVKVGPPDAHQEHHDLKGVLVETIKGLDALTEDIPIETMSSLRQQIRAVVRQQLDHAVARIAGWWPPPEMTTETPG